MAKTAVIRSGKRVAIKSYATINPGEIRFGRSVEERLFKKKRT
jgi:hypothetical protein